MLAGHVYYSEEISKPVRSNARRPVKLRNTERQQGVPPEMSEILLLRLSEISQQLGSSTAAIEALREDLRTANEDSRHFNTDISARLDNITVRVGKLETQMEHTKNRVDVDIMPLVEASNLRRQQITGALKVWGVGLAVVGGFSAVFWSRLLNFLIWASGHGGSGP